MWWNQAWFKYPVEKIIKLSKMAATIDRSKRFINFHDAKSGKETETYTNQYSWLLMFW
jgi:hypothetical protein